MDTDTPSTVEAPETFEMSESRLALLEGKLERLSRRAMHIGLPSVTYEKVSERHVPLRDNPGRVRTFVTVRLVGTAPVLLGYTFLARTEHTTAGNIMARAPGCERIEIPASLRDGAAFCDHCKTARRRLDTFILQTPDGELMRVGRSCLADYIRSADVAVAIQIWNIIAEFRASSGSGEDDEGIGGSGVPDLSLRFFVAASFRAATTIGWVGRTEARTSGRQATADVALFAASPPPQNARQREEWQSVQPTEADYKVAKEAIEWARTLEGYNDYENNLKVVCAFDVLKERNAGLAASVVSSFQRFRERELAKSRPASTTPSEFFGREGAKYLRKLTVMKATSMDSGYGPTVLYTMNDDTGNEFKWFVAGGASAPSTVQPVRDLQVGDSFFFTFTVKKHADYKGQKSTMINRACSGGTPEAHKIKWLSPTTGEIFSTKKALLAASSV